MRLLLVLQSVTAAESMHRVPGIVAVHQTWVTAVLCVNQKVIGVSGVTSEAVTSWSSKA